MVKHLTSRTLSILVAVRTLFRVQKSLVVLHKQTNLVCELHERGNKRRSVRDGEQKMKMAKKRKQQHAKNGIIKASMGFEEAEDQFSSFSTNIKCEILQARWLRLVEDDGFRGLVVRGSEFFVDDHLGDDAVNSNLRELVHHPGYEETSK